MKSKWWKKWGNKALPAYKMNFSVLLTKGDFIEHLANRYVFSSDDDLPKIQELTKLKAWQLVQRDYKQYGWSGVANYSEQISELDQEQQELIYPLITKWVEDNFPYLNEEPKCWEEI